MKKPREQFEIFSYDETHDVDSFLKVIDKLEAEAKQKNNDELGVENNPSFCDTDWYFEKRGAK